MRYRCQLFTADGAIDSDDFIENVDGSRWREDDVHILSRAAVDTVQYNFTNGMKVILGPMEYECIVCGEYDHDESECPEDCPLDSDDPFDERDYDPVQITPTLAVTSQPLQINLDGLTDNLSDGL